MKRMKFLIMSFMILVQSPLWAQTTDNQDSMLISEEEISKNNETTDLEWMQVDTYVTTASRKKERIQEAPANITVLTRAQIQELGATSLAEVLSFIPGITMIESHFGYTDVVFRGIYQELNNKGLMLINGHPAWDVIHGSYHLEQIPVDAIKQIEVIRGPGSVLYGTNAYAGVINIITYDGSDKNINKVSIKGGSFSTQEYSLSGGLKAEEVKLFASASYVDTDGYEYRVKADELGQSGVLDYATTYENAYVGMSYKELTFNYGYFNQDKEKVGFLPILLTGGENHFENYFTDLKFDHAFTDELSMQVTGRYDRMRIDYDIYNALGGLSSVPVDGSKYGGELQLNYAPSDKIYLTLGGSWDRYVINLDWKTRIVPTALGNFIAYYDLDDVKERAAYTNLNWKLLDELSFVAGVRYTDNSGSGNGVCPNAGLIYGIGDKKYVKFLYGEAFRSPNFFETSVHMPGVSYGGNPDLEAERIRTYDLGVDLMFADRYNVKTNIYYLSTYDSIVKGPELYVNGSGQEVWGIEMDLRADINQDFSIFLNGTANDGEMKKTDMDVAFLVKYTANTGFTWKVVDAFRLTANMQYVDEREDNDREYAADAYTLFNMQGIYSFNESLKLRLIANNIFDEEYEYPEFKRQVIGDCGNGPERAFYGKVEYLF